MKFKDLCGVLYRINPISICDKETLNYENFLLVKDVPEEYDDLTVCGVGMINSEFYNIAEGVYSTDKRGGELEFIPCIEIVTTTTTGE